MLRADRNNEVRHVQCAAAQEGVRAPTQICVFSAERCMMKDFLLRAVRTGGARYDVRAA